MAHTLVRKFARGLTFSNVCSFLALTIALGTGTAYAANTVGSSDIIDESILSVDIKNGAVTGSDIHNATVRTADLAPDAVTGANVLDETLTSADLGTNSVGATEIADNTIDTGEIVDNSLFAQDLAPDSVGGSEIAANAVTGGDVANESLTLADLLGANLSGSISLSGIPNGRCNQVTFGVGGAAVGQAALVMTGAAIQDGILLYANRVSSAGHVEVNACNFSGGAMTPLSGFPVRVVTFG